MTRKLRSKLTPPQLAEKWGISPEKVLGWIRSGELRAVNAASRRDGRPRFLIDVDDIAAFEERRAVHSTPRVARKKNHPERNIIEFF